MKLYRATKAARIPTTLLGGARIALHTYLPSKKCKRCEQQKAAAEFLKLWRINHSGAIELSFGETCQACERPPRPFPAQLNGARFKSNFVSDSGEISGWSERDEYGLFSVRNLATLTVRNVKGVFRPQPKLNRKTGQERNISTQENVVIDSKRLFDDSDLLNAIREQKGLCAICEEPFTEADGPVADHTKPHAKGFPTISSNCQAAHAICNSSKGTRTVAQTRKYGRLRVFEKYQQEQQEKE